jgi:hypothetical protein
VFILGNPLQSSLMFVGEARSLPDSNTFKALYSMVGSLPSSSIRLGLPGSDTLAHFTKAFVGKTKGMTLTQGANVINLFMAVIYKF